LFLYPNLCAYIISVETVRRKCNPVRLTLLACTHTHTHARAHTHTYSHTHMHTQVNHREDYELSGHLEVQYSNGDTQQLPLTARIQHPALRLMHAQQLPKNAASLPMSKPAVRNWSAPLVFGQVRPSLSFLGWYYGFINNYLFSFHTFQLTMHVSSYPFLRPCQNWTKRVLC